jgi:hypothetical protein
MKRRRPLRLGVRLVPIVGKRYINRAGATVRISYIQPSPIWPFIVCVVDGAEPHKISLCPDGRFFPRDEDHGYDLMREVV